MTCSPACKNGCTCVVDKSHRRKARVQSASEIRPCKAIRLTEKDLKRLDNDIEKTILRLAERFGECDGGIERMLDNFMRDTRQWADDLREHMKERTSDGETWEL